MNSCQTCEGPMPDESKDIFCGVCLTVLPDIVNIPSGRSMLSIDQDIKQIREELGNPGTNLREIWSSVRDLEGKEDIAWLYDNANSPIAQEWRWITSPPPALRLDDDVLQFLGDRTFIRRDNLDHTAIMRNLQRGGLLPSGHFLSWTGGRWFLDGRELEVPHLLLRTMLDQGGKHERINWGRLLLTIDLAVTQIVNRGQLLGRPGSGTTLNPGLFLVASRTGRVRNFTSYKNHGQSRLSSHPRQFGNARWLESWSRRSSQDMVMPGLPDIEMAMQSCSIVIRKGKLSIRVRRPGGKFRLIGIPPQPDLVARICSWFLSHPSSRSFRRLECLRTRIFAGPDSSLVDGPERVALKLLRSVHDSTEGCSLDPSKRSFRVVGTSGLAYLIRSCPRGQGAHGSRFKIRCLGPDGDSHREPEPWNAHRDDICIRESQGPRLPLGDVIVQAILTVSQDTEAAKNGIQSIAQNITRWEHRLNQSRRMRLRREDPIGEAFRGVERLAGRMRRNWIHRRVRRAIGSFPALWSAMIRAPVGSTMRFTSLENASREPGRPNVVFDGISTRFRTESQSERQIVRLMLLGSGWTRQTDQEIRTGVRQIWHRTRRSEDADLQAAVTNFCRSLENLIQVNGRRPPIAPENLQLSFEANSEVYGTALLPGSRGFLN